MNSTVNAIEQVIGYAALLPFVYIFIDYGIIRSFARKNGRRKYDPFWLTGVGWMFFLLSFAITMSAIRAFLKLFLDPNTPAMQIILALTYVLGIGAAAMLVVVYLVEKNSGWMVLAPPQIRKEQRQVWSDLENSRGKAARDAYLRTHPHERKPKTGPVDHVK